MRLAGGCRGSFGGWIAGAWSGGKIGRQTGPVPVSLADYSASSNYAARTGGPPRPDRPVRKECRLGLARGMRQVGRQIDRPQVCAWRSRKEHTVFSGLWTASSDAQMLREGLTPMTN